MNPSAGVTLGTLKFEAAMPVNDTYHVFSNYSGKWVGGTLTNGWNFRGKLVQERLQQTISASPFGLDFNAARCLDLLIATAAVSFYTINASGTPTNFEQRTVLLRSGA